MFQLFFFLSFTEMGCVSAGCLSESPIFVRGVWRWRECSNTGRGTCRDNGLRNNAIKKAYVKNMESHDVGVVCVSSIVIDVFCSECQTCVHKLLVLLVFWVSGHSSRPPPHTPSCKYHLRLGVVWRNMVTGGVSGRGVCSKVTSPKCCA